MNAPKPIEFGEHIFELAFHPTERIVATGLITGEVVVTAVDAAAGNREIHRLKHHKKSCRALLFSDNGQALFSASSDKSIQAINMETGAVFHKLPKAHGDPINTMLRVDNDLFASGDDGGTVKLWDLRQQRAIREYAAQDDFVSEMVYNPEHNILLSASGDGTLAVYDIRYHKEVHVSDNQEDELLSIAIVRSGTKVICGTQEGIINIWSWGLWGDISDRFPGHPNSIDTMAVVTSPGGEELVCTGSSDGHIRVVTILPNKLVGVIGDHDGFPVERIRVTRDNTLMASCSHDETVRFWDLAYLLDEDADDDDEAGEGDGDAMDTAGSTGGVRARQDSDDSDEEEAPRRSRKRNKGKSRATDPGSFFDDLE